MHDPVAVPLERRPDAARLLRALAPTRLVRADGVRRQRDVLERADALGERVCDTPGNLHPVSVDAVSALAWLNLQATRSIAAKTTPCAVQITVRGALPRTSERIRSSSYPRASSACAGP